MFAKADRDYSPGFMETGTDKGPRWCLEVGEDILRHSHVESTVRGGAGDTSKMVQLGPRDGGMPRAMSD